MFKYCIHHHYFWVLCLIANHKFICQKSVKYFSILETCLHAWTCSFRNISSFGVIIFILCFRNDSCEIFIFYFHSRHIKTLTDNIPYLNVVNHEIITLSNIPPSIELTIKKRRPWRRLYFWQVHWCHHYSREISLRFNEIDKKLRHKLLECMCPLMITRVKIECWK